jgi:hypothetical protein
MAYITLSSDDLFLAATAGVMRNIENIKLGRKPAHGIERTTIGDWQSHITGAAGELAVARFYGMQWLGKGKFRGADVGENAQVRTAEQAEGRRVSLILHPDDEDDALFYPVRRFPYTNRFEIFKPVRGRDGKRNEYWNTTTGRPAFFVPIHPEDA